MTGARSHLSLAFNYGAAVCSRRAITVEHRDHLLEAMRCAGAAKAPWWVARDGRTPTPVALSRWRAAAHSIRSGQLITRAPSQWDGCSNVETHAAIRAWGTDPGSGALVGIAVLGLVRRRHE